MTEKKEKKPIAWESLTPDEQEAVQKMAQDKMFWIALKAKLGGYGETVKMLSVLLMAYIAIKEGLVEWLLRRLGG